MTPDWVSPRDALHKEIAKLREEIEVKDAIIFELVNGGAVITDFDIYRRWKFTKREEQIFCMLLTGRCITIQALLATMYAASNDLPDENIFRTFICKIRKKLSADGVLIQNVWGRGWIMDQEYIDKVKSICSVSLAA